MNPQLREAIGKASYEALIDDLETPWDKLSEDAREINRKSAEAAVEAFIGPLLPNITPVVNALIAVNPEFEKATKELIREATGKQE